MKRLLLVYLSLFILGCGSDDDSIVDFVFSPTTSWELEATLNDPGDGSGTFETVVSDRILVFEAHRVITNGSLCLLDGPVGTEEFVMLERDIAEFFVKDCDSTGIPRRLTYSLLNDPNLLVVDLGCDEPCLLRYKRLEQ